MTEAIDLLARQDALQREADAVLEDIDLIARISALGRPVRTGASALGLMVARDIDVTTLCPSLDVAGVFELGRRLSLHPRVRRLTFRNDTGHWNTDPNYPDGLYWRVEYVSDAGEEWTLDLWFILEGATQFDLEHMRTLPPRLTDEARADILRIKQAVHGQTPAVRSYRVYEAVLDHGVRTVEEFQRHLQMSASAAG
jgi:hypothetical protein